MKKLSILFLFFCFPSLHANETPRRLIVLFDWQEEGISQDLDKTTYSAEKNGWGPISANLITALAQKAAPIIVTSHLWHNFVARRKLLKDFLEGHGQDYKKYTRFKNETAIKQFKTYIQAYFQPNGEKILGGFESPIRKELESYFLSYITPFEEKDWVLKKASNYIYVLIPQMYLLQLRSKPLPKTERNFATRLEDNDLYLGLKIAAMPTMSYQDALNPDKHKITIDYAQLLNEQGLLTPLHYGINPPEAIILSWHFINMLKNIFVTTLDLIDKNKDVEKTELNRALYLYKWHIYLNGHGSILKEIDIADTSIRVQSAYLAGMEFLAFREWLFFLNSSINTEFLFYESCYSGGPQLQKPYEFQWDYSTGKTKKIETKSDVFKYTIVAGNFAYTLTKYEMPFILPPFKKAKFTEIHINYRVQFVAFFKAIERYFSIDHIAIAQKDIFFDTFKKLKALKNTLRGKISLVYLYQTNNAIENLINALEKIHFITLSSVIDYVHNVERNRPAVRYPGTEWFVPLPMDEKQEIIERIRWETDQQKEAREKEKKRIKNIIEQHISGESTLRKTLHTLKQKLVQLKKSIQNISCKN